MKKSYFIHGRFPALLLGITALCITSCSKDYKAEPPRQPLETTQPSGLASPQTTPTCCWISTTNDADHQVDVWNPADSPWTTSNIRWSWKPTTALGYNATTEIPLWTDPTDVKVRNNAAFGVSQVIIAASYRLATIATYPGGVHIWACGFPSGIQLHGVEILPSGNCVVANAEPGTAGYIRIFSSSQPPPGHTKGAIYSFPSAHAVLWDASHNCLWALGNALRKYTVGPSLTNPTLNLVSTYTLKTPWGHDLSAYTGDSNLMWVSTNGGTYTFDKTTGLFTPLTGAAQNVFVKGLSDQPGQSRIVETIEDTNSCTLNNWCTRTITFFDLTTGAQTGTRTVSSAAFYKAKTWDPYYY
ncbi:MAG TPA: DUF6528 family protein [Puia sp.]|nr:DUF6528 family protein [Puia sp.]